MSKVVYITAPLKESVHGRLVQGNFKNYLNSKLRYEKGYIEDSFKPSKFVNVCH